jgi:parvulin-like peptidyl-prolyl isomerase
MTEFVKIGNFQVPQVELVNLLARYQILPTLLRELTLDRAIVEIQCSDVEQDLAIQQFRDRYGLISDEQIQQWLDLHSLNSQQLAEIAIRQFKIEKLKIENWGGKTEAYFLKRKGQLDRAIYSLIRTKDLGIAQEIYFRLIDGEETFAEIARKYSQGPEAKTGGLIGPVEIITPHPAIAHLITTQPIGKICQPIQLEQWYAIVRPEQIIPAQLDESMRQRLIDELFQIWLQSQIKLTDISTPIPISLPETMKL